jgi:hypothetical protein
MVKKFIKSNYMVKKANELPKLNSILPAPNFKLINILKDDPKS